MQRTQNTQQCGEEKLLEECVRVMWCSYLNCIEISQEKKITLYGENNVIVGGGGGNLIFPAVLLFQYRGGAWERVLTY